MNGLPDIPRLYTALAEWGACMVFLLVLKRRWTGWRMWALAGGALAAQGLFLSLTGDLAIGFWIPCMAIAVGMMFLFIWAGCAVSPGDAAYYCVRAFVLAELAASLEWQLHCFFWPQGEPWSVPGLGMLAAVYGGVFLFMWRLERQHMPREGRLGAHPGELGSAVIIGMAVFAISNISFLAVHTPFSGAYSAILILRTVVDLGGLAILYAHHVLCCELRVRGELEAMESILQNQYLQYQQSKESIALIDRKYHDLKHQIAVLRAEPDEEKRSAYLDEMENEIRTYEAQNKTGNPVLDTVLTGKSLYCVQHGITLTCVADGKLLDFMDVMDLCSVFGNALDNAIECVEKLEPAEKRLIHVTVSAQKEFVLLRFENYCEAVPAFDDGLPVTTKGDAAYHGYGLKSIRFIARKYGGSMTVRTEKNWFELRVLLPREGQEPG